MTLVSNIRIKKYSKAEVLKHNKKDDCWIIIDNSVFDITDFLSKHPGGSDILMSRAGEDATTYFITKHGLDNNIKERLNKFKVGELYEDEKINVKDLDEPFLKELLENVRQQKLYNVAVPEKTKFKLIRVTMLMLFFLFSVYALYFSGSILISLALLFSQALLSISLFGLIAHEATHRNFPKNRLLKITLEAIWPILWPFISKKPLFYEHNSHHIKIGDEDYDYEVAAFSNFIKYSDTVSTQKVHRYQHKLAMFYYPIYANIITTIGGLKSTFWANHNRTVALYHTISLIVTFTYYVIVPSIILGFSYKFLGFYLFFQSILFTGIYIGAAINHFVPSVMNAIPSQYQNKYAYYVCANTTNFGKNNAIYFWLSGGFNIQIEHHLIPFVPVENLRKLSLIVEDLCMKYNYPYKNYLSIKELWNDHYAYLSLIKEENKNSNELKNKGNYQAR
jgi:fatty acid desaturase